MFDDLSPALLSERKELIEKIDDAFGGINREGGVSWSETRVLDDCGSDEERALARSRDTEISWQALIEAEGWDPEMGVGGWAFLDAIGFRYYLPAAMVRSLQTTYDFGLQYHLTLPRWFLRRHSKAQWEALDRRQEHTVKLFIGTMVALSLELENLSGAQRWRRAGESYWDSLPDPGDGA